jgi:FkbM family methyltransferase
VSFTPYIAKIRTFQGERFDFHIADEVGQSWYDSSPHQIMIEHVWCRDHIRPGMTVVDCGAHHGMMTVLFGRWLGPAGRVFAYEAVPANATVIEQNVALNKLDNVTVRPVGVGDRRGRVPVHHNSGNVIAAGAKAEGASHFIDTVRLDEDLPSGLKVDFLKLDVEGYEPEALAGANRVIRQRPIIDLELHNFAYSDRRSTLELIFRHITPEAWSFHIQPTPSDTFEPMTGPIDFNRLASFENPHVFCLPRGGIRNKLARWKAQIGF